jgi:hypothetical protein
MKTAPNCYPLSTCPNKKSVAWMEWFSSSTMEKFMRFWVFHESRFHQWLLILLFALPNKY